MQRLPAEILISIAKELTLRDLKSLRLTNTTLANVGHSILASHLSILNVSRCLDDFESYVRRSGPSPFTIQLTIYHGRWPDCTRQEWELHPLQQSEMHPRFLLENQKSRRALDMAYEEYRTFIGEEASRDPIREVERFKKILSCFPNLRTLTIAHLKTWRGRIRAHPSFLGIKKAIWICPVVNDPVDSLTERLLDLLPRDGNLRNIVVEGRLTPGLSAIQSVLENIRSLKLNAVEIGAPKAKNILALLKHHFPNLEELSIGLTAGSIMKSPLSLERQLWPALRTLSIRNVWVTEQALVRIVEVHHLLTSIYLTDIKLDQGTWQSFLSRVKGLQRDVSVVEDLSASQSDHRFTGIEPAISPS